MHCTPFGKWYKTLKAKQMKKLIFMFTMAVAIAATTVQSARAQVSVNCNIGNQPMWGPTGYDYAGYYYMPDIDAYYCVDDGQFVYQDNGDWIYGNSLPYQYRNYDLYNGYKVVINGSRPWLRNNYYRRQYWGYRGRRNQPFIRDSRDYRYFQNSNHPYHNQWRGDGYYGRNGYGRGGYNGYSRGFNDYEGRQSNGGYRRDEFRGGDRRDGSWNGRRGDGGGRDWNRGDDGGRRGGDRSWNGGRR